MKIINETPKTIVRGKRRLLLLSTAKVLPAGIEESSLPLGIIAPFSGAFSSSDDVFRLHPEESLAHGDLYFYSLNFGADALLACELRICHEL